ncbi:MAG: heavy-metal-associated domain-containing protein [Chloroflexota bacterium]
MPRVTASAKRVAGVEKVQVDLGGRIVTVTYDPTQATPDAIKMALETGGDTVLPTPE